MVFTQDVFLTADKLAKFTKNLEQRRYTELQCIAPFTAMEAKTGVDEVNNKIPEKIEGMEIKLHDFFIGRDRYLWMQKKVVLPAHKDGMQVTGIFDFGIANQGLSTGFESLLYVNGHPYQAVDINHQEVNFEELAGQEVELTFLLWTGLERGGEPQTLYHHIKQADIGYLHEQTDEFYYLSLCISEELKYLTEEDENRFGVISALDSAYRMINWDADKFYSTMGPALTHLKGRLSDMKKNTGITINCIGHTHIDVAYMWRYKHTREKAMRSFSTVTKLMKEFEEYSFLQTQPQLYKYLKEDSPELYGRIQELVKQGRWEPDGGMWLEADCNLSSGEALVRQFLYGVRFFREEFGVECKFLWLPDVFGYSWALPQILKQCNIDTFCTSKISWNQYNSMPNDLFIWRGIDGTDMMTYFINTPRNDNLADIRATYNGEITASTVMLGWKKFKNKNLSKDILISYGYGDGGGGVTRDMLKRRRALDSLPGVPNVKTARADDFFAKLHHNLETTEEYVPVWDGELYLEFHRGTYTAQARNKKWNRYLEFKLADLEWLASLNYLQGGKYDAQTLYECWETVLRNQFHDVIPGSAIHDAFVDSRKEYEKANADADKVKESVVCSLMKPVENTWSICNSGSFARTDAVCIKTDKACSFYDENGKQLPAQPVDGGYCISVKSEPLSIHTITAKEETAEQGNKAVVDLQNRMVETAYYRISWDENGALNSIFDKENGREVLAENRLGNVFEVFEDKPLNYDNWNIELYYSQKKDIVKACAPAKLLENGEVRTVIHFSYTYHLTKIEQDMIVYNDNRRIDFKTWVDWQEADRLLKVAFPVDIRSTKASYDIQFGYVERPTHYNTSWDYARFEVVGHKWADLSENGYGVSLMNDCKYGYSIFENVMSLTLLKSTKYPDTTMDMCEHTFTYALYPHAGTLVEGGVIEESTALNLPLTVSCGSPKNSSKIFTIEGNGVNVDAIKKAESEDCLILRVHECFGGKTHVKVGSEYGITRYATCNLLEDRETEPVSGSAIEFDLKPFEIKTFMVWFS